MDFGALAPEINSARIYFGPGSGPMMAAAAAWDGLATELSSAATDYGSVTSRLTAGPWRGSASASMAAAAAPYVAWISTTAAQAEQVATQARAAAAAYETALASMVPPPVIAANRALLMSLIATNILGQNTPAITDTEAHYGEMWAQDAAAMYSYAGSSAAAATLTPFTPPPQTANRTALAAQGMAVAQVTGTSAATNTQAALSQVTSTVPTALQGLASPLSSTSVTSSLGSLSTGMSMTSSVGWISSALLSNANQVKNLLPVASAASTAASGSGLTSGLASGLTAGLGSGAMGSTGFTGLSAAVSAGTGRAASVGALSVPQSWGAAVPAISPAATALPGTGLGTVPAGVAGDPGGMLGGLPLAGATARGIPGGLPDARFLERPPMVPSWSPLG